MKVSLSIAKPQVLALAYPNSDPIIQVLHSLQKDLDKAFKGEVSIFLDEETSQISINGIAYAEDLGFSRVGISIEKVDEMLSNILRKHLEYEFLDIYPRYKLDRYDHDNVRISEAENTSDLRI